MCVEYLHVAVWIVLLSDYIAIPMSLLPLHCQLPAVNWRNVELLRNSLVYVHVCVYAQPWRCHGSPSPSPVHCGALYK